MEELLSAEGGIVGLRCSIWIEGNGVATLNVVHCFWMFTEDTTEELGLSKFEGTVIKPLNIDTEVMVGFFVDGDFESFPHHVLEFFNIPEVISRNHGVIHMNPDIDATPVAGDEFRGSQALPNFW